MVGRPARISTWGELAPHMFLLTWLLTTYGNDVFMVHVYQPEYHELMAAEPVFV